MAHSGVDHESRDAVWPARARAAAFRVVGGALAIAGAGALLGLAHAAVHPRRIVVTAQVAPALPDQPANPQPFGPPPQQPIDVAKAGAPTQPGPDASNVPGVIVDPSQTGHGANDRAVDAPGDSGQPPSTPPPQRRVPPAGSLSGSGGASGGGAEPPATQPAEDDAGGIRMATLAQAKSLFDEGTPFIDARRRPSYEDAHIAGAIWLPATELSRGGSAVEELQFLDPSAPLVVYCQGGDCADAKNTAALLQEYFGFRDIRILEAGLVDWAAEGYPVEGGTPR